MGRVSAELTSWYKVDQDTLSVELLFFFLECCDDLEEGIKRTVLYTSTTSIHLTQLCDCSLFLKEVLKVQNSLKAN